MAVNVAMLAKNSARLRQSERPSRRAGSFSLLSSPRQAIPKIDIGIKKSTTVMAYIPVNLRGHMLLTALEHYLARKVIPPTPDKRGTRTSGICRESCSGIYPVPRLLGTYAVVAA